MDIAEFEEKQYECGLIWELAGRSPDFFPSGQALENVLGYDFAISPGDPFIFDLLNTGLPSGILLTPSLWPAAKRPPAKRLPSTLVSLIVQTKRPQLLDHWLAGQHHYWRGPYFRFHIDLRQQRVLEALEVAVASNAVIRYASAAFTEYRVLERHQRARTIAEHSTFVSPRALTGHRLWSYSGPGITGFANPEGEPQSADTFETLLESARSLATHETLTEHFHILAEAVRPVLAEARRPVMPTDGEWLSVLTQTFDISTDVTQVVADWAAVSAAVAMTGAMWLVLGFD